MDTKIKNRIISVSFIFILGAMMIINILSPDKEISYEERRKLSTFPNFKVEDILNGDYFEQMEDYFLDQFYLRENFRKVKAFVNNKIFKEKDNNNIYIVDDGIYKMEYGLNEKSILNSANLYNKIKNTYFKNCNAYYTIIPDKNYFVAEKENYLHLDYKKLIDIMNKNTFDMNYINIVDALQINDYYRTDLHWRQDKIEKIADKILKSMNNKSSNLTYDKKEFELFYGSYYGQAATNIKPDKLVYLNNEILKKCRVYDYQKGDYIKIYNDKDFKNIDSYDVYLGGAKPLLTIENPSNKSDNELYIFRDSFGSSLAPLLVNEYSKITLVDLRYINSVYFQKFIQVKENSDVLFMYNTSILNNSSIITKFLPN